MRCVLWPQVGPERRWCLQRRLDRAAVAAGRTESFRVFHDAFRTVIQSTATGKYQACAAGEGEVSAAAGSYSADAAKWILLYPQDPGS